MIIASLTTIPSRIDLLKPILDSVLNQTIPIDHIEINIPYTCLRTEEEYTIPEWMETIDEEGNNVIKNNGVWTNTTLNIPELIATYLKVWLEDAIPSELTDAIESSKGQYTSEKQLTAITEVYGGLISNRISELNNMLNSIKEQEPAEVETINN